MKTLNKVAIGLVALSFSILPMTSLAAEQATPAQTPAKVAAPAQAQPAMKKAEKPAHKITHHRGIPAKEAMEVQKALNTHGAKLKVDGKFGKASREALKKFQKENGLKATGHLNKVTMAKLQISGK